MIKLDICIFGICLKLDLHIHRVPKNADKCNQELNTEEHEESDNQTPIYEDNPSNYLFDESKIAQIANQFQEELKHSEIYDIPDYSDIPKRNNIQDDVEIITDKFEKEIEDILEGRR